MASLKPFYINVNDLKFLLAQVNFVPLFDGAANSNGLVAFDGTVDAYSADGVLLWNAQTQSLTAEAIALGFGTLGDLGPGFPQVSAPSGVRDVSGCTTTCLAIRPSGVRRTCRSGATSRRISRTT